MALLFSPSFNEMLANQYQKGFSAAANGAVISLHPGVQPTADDVLANWSLYTTSGNLLWVRGGFLFSTSGTSIYASTFGTPIAPVKDGVATWAIIWSAASGANITSASPPFNTTTLSANYQKLMVGPVTDTTGNGLVRLSSTNLTIAGGAIMIADAGFTVAP